MAHNLSETYLIIIFGGIFFSLFHFRAVFFNSIQTNFYLYTVILKLMENVKFFMIIDFVLSSVIERTFVVIVVVRIKVKNI